MATLFKALSDADTQKFQDVAYILNRPLDVAPFQEDKLKIFSKAMSIIRKQVNVIEQQCHVKCMLFYVDHDNLSVPPEFLACSSLFQLARREMANGIGQRMVAEKHARPPAPVESAKKRVLGLFDKLVDDRMHFPWILL